MLDTPLKGTFYSIRKFQRQFNTKELYNRVEKSVKTNQIMTNDNLDVDKVTWDRIYNSLSIMLLILDKKGKAINCNSAFRKYLRKPKLEIIGNSLLEILYGEKDIPKGLVKGLEITKKRQSANIKVKNRWLKISIDPVLSGRRKIKNMIVVITDITERKNNIRELELRERKYKDIVELSNIAIATDNRDGNLVYFNNQFANLFGYTEAELKNLTHKDLVHPDDIQRMINIHNNRVNGKQQPGRYEFKGIRKSGEIIYIDISVTDILEENGQIIGTRSYLRDITERKKFIEELEIVLEKAKESDLLKSAFLANLSHEVRTPINGIVGFSKLLERENLTKEENQNYIKIINSCSNQLLSIMRDILDFSKIETGQLEINEKTFKLNNFIELIYARFQPEFQLKGLNYSWSAHPSGNISVTTDKGKLDQIISNLIKNALKFTNEGTVELACEIKSDFIEIFVKDSGIGIEKSMHNIIFDRFYQIEIELSKKYDGNGLGLSICKGFTDILKGKIWVNSEKGKGSTFHLKVPIK